MAAPRYGLLMLAAGMLLSLSSAADLRAQHHQLLLQARQNPLASFREWVTQHAKEYINDVVELEKRFAIWLANLEYVIQYNAQGHSHWLGMNALADLTHEEYKARYARGFNNAQRLAENRPLTPFSYSSVSDEQLPASIDWRKLNAVSEVKNQQQCGSCWAFSTTGSVEGINAIYTKELLSLSEQLLVDCDTEEDKGCNGGLMDYAFKFIMENKGITTEEDYPYKAERRECNNRKKHHHYVTIDGFEDVPPNDEAALKKAVAHQPVSVAIEADQKAFQLYAGGVFDDPDCGTELDHGVLVVGYGRDSKEGPYWIVKNSWGDQWGDQGYIKLRLGANNKEGMCGITMAASYPTKKSPNPPKPGAEPPEPAPGPEPGPGPEPEPVQCDDSSECPAETTCCCVSAVFNMCFQWGCCPMVNATCCEDHEHCCPESLPVCDTKGGRCMPKKGDLAGSIPWLKKLPANRVKGGPLDKIMGSRKVQQ